MLLGVILVMQVGTTDIYCITQPKGRYVVIEKRESEMIEDVKSDHISLCACCCHHVQDRLSTASPSFDNGTGVPAHPLNPYTYSLSFVRLLYYNTQRVAITKVCCS
jgi:hypothetical protein